MGRQQYPYRQIGRPALKVTAKYAVLRNIRQANFYFGLIQRTRTTDGQDPEVAYAVVRFTAPIPSNGTMLRALEAVPYLSKGFPQKRPCKAADPEAWHSSLETAEAKFWANLRRATPPKKAKPVPVPAKSGGAK